MGRSGAGSRPSEVRVRRTSAEQCASSSLNSMAGKGPTRAPPTRIGFARYDSRAMHKTFSLAALLLAGPLAAQSLTLDVVGGSLPGPLDITLSSGSFGFTGVVILSVSPGPTNLFLIDPTDPRHLDVGLESLGISPIGPFDLSGKFKVPTLAVPNNPAFVDAAVFTQGISLPGSPYLVGPISQPRPVRFAAAGAFRDRRTQFITPRAFFPVLPLADHRWMIAGGGSGGLLSQAAQNTTEVYDPLTDAFTQGPTMNYEHSLHTATKLKDGRWFIACGVDRFNDPQGTCEVYEPSTHTFKKVAAGTDPRMGHTATLLPSGKVLVTGGLSDLNALSSPLDPIYSALKSTEIYDPVSNTWANGPAMSIPRAGHGAITLPDNRVLLCGGISYTTFIIKIPTVPVSTEIYDPVTNTISPGPNMSAGHAVFSAIEIAPGKHLIAGGIGALSLTNQGTPTDVAEIYTASSGAPGAFSPAGKLAKARGMHMAFALGSDRYLHVGGAEGAIFTPNALASTEIYTATTNTWSAGPTLNLSRSGYGAFLAPTGQIHLLGGGSGPGAPTVNFTEWYFR